MRPSGAHILCLTGAPITTNREIQMYINASIYLSADTYRELHQLCAENTKPLPNFHTFNVKVYDVPTQYVVHFHKNRAQKLDRLVSNEVFHYETLRQCDPQNLFGLDFLKYINGVLRYTRPYQEEMTKIAGHMALNKPRSETGL